jgi:hypothetical protein
MSWKPEDEDVLGVPNARIALEKPSGNTDERIPLLENRQARSAFRAERTVHAGRGLERNDEVLATEVFEVASAHHDDRSGGGVVRFAAAGAVTADHVEGRTDHNPMTLRPWSAQYTG